MSELNTVVILPIHKQRIRTVGLYSINGELRINKYTPAVTIVAATSLRLLDTNYSKTSVILPCGGGCEASHLGGVSHRGEIRTLCFTSK